MNCSAQFPLLSLGRPSFGQVAVAGIRSRSRVSKFPFVSPALPGWKDRYPGEEKITVWRSSFAGIGKHREFFAGRGDDIQGNFVEKPLHSQKRCKMCFVEMRPPTLRRSRSLRPRSSSSEKPVHRQNV